MKTKLTTLALSFLTSLALAHEGVEIGPNGGRILEFSKDETMHGEIAVKGDSFHIALLDKDKKPVSVTEQTLTAITGDRNSPQKLEVTQSEKGFTLPLVKAGEWLILQFKLNPKAKAITARMEYNTSECEECKSPEWLCKCKPEAEKK
jgi:hypothetical protein